MFMCSVGLSKVGRYYVSLFKSHVQVIKAFYVFHTHPPVIFPPSLLPFLFFLPFCVSCPQSSGVSGFCFVFSLTKRVLTVCVLWTVENIGGTAS